jgi:hypothetical protein
METATLAKAEEAYMRLAKTRHPDRGGMHDQMASINVAIATARREFMTDRPTRLR